MVHVCHVIDVLSSDQNMDANFERAMRAVRRERETDWRSRLNTAAPTPAPTPTTVLSETVLSPVPDAPTVQATAATASSEDMEKVLQNALTLFRVQSEGVTRGDVLDQNWQYALSASVDVIADEIAVAQDVKRFVLEREMPSLEKSDRRILRRARLDFAAYMTMVGASS